jgi:hypothetical protein
MHELLAALLSISVVLLAVESSIGSALINGDGQDFIPVD